MDNMNKQLREVYKSIGEKSEHAHAATDKLSAMLEKTHEMATAAYKHASVGSLASQARLSARMSASVRCQ